jgi:pilus assembly protein CpaC
LIWGQTRILSAVLVVGALAPNGRVALAQQEAKAEQTTRPVPGSVIPPLQVGDSLVREAGESSAELEVQIGLAKRLNLTEPITRIVVADPDVADATALSPTQIQITGLRTGMTRLTLSVQRGAEYSYLVRVVAGDAELQKLVVLLDQLFPNTQLGLRRINDEVVLDGQVHDLSEMESALKVIRSKLQIRPDQIVNLARVTGPQQVMLQVQIAELNRTALRRFGVEFSEVRDASTGSSGPFWTAGTTLGAATPFPFGGGTEFTDDVTAITVFDDPEFFALWSALHRNGLMRVLAEPTLVALNGHAASFLAGGEFPISVPQSAGTGIGGATVEFKRFGTLLSFTPTILDRDLVRLSIDAEFSETDSTNEVTLVAGGSPVKGLRSRNTGTTVELREGQSLAISGLIQQVTEGANSRIPLLGDIPWIGTLFSSKEYERTETELVILVTPHLVQPVAADELPPLPGTLVTEPTDHEFFLNGRIEGRAGSNFRSTIPKMHRSSHRSHDVKTDSPALFGHED